MMTRLPIRERFAIVLVVLALLSTMAWAQPLLTIRVASLDAALTDLENLGEFIGEPITKEEALAALESMLEIDGFENVDLNRPAAVVLPVQGMLLQAQGLIVVIPVKDVDHTLALLGERFPGGKTEGGIAEFAIDKTTTLFIRTHEGYLMAATNRQIAEDAVLSDLLSDSAMPPGNIGASFQIEPIAPIIQMALMQARGFVAAQAKKGNAPVGETVGEKSGEGDVPPTAAGTNLQAALPLMDLYFQLINDFVDNTSALEFSLELSGGHMLFHEWVLPRGSSTLEEVIAAQEGQFPKIAGFVDGRAPVVIAGTVKITPKMRTAIESYAESYGSGMEKLFRSSTLKEKPGSENPGASLIAMIAPLKQYMSKSLGCHRGDMASSVSFDEEGGLEIEQIQGLSSDEGCSTLLTTFANIMRSTTEAEGVESPFRIEEKALTHRGVSATRWSMKIPAIPDEKGKKLLNTLYGGDSLESMMGADDSLMLTTMGADADARFKKLVDRIRSGSSSGGVTRADFAPLAPTSGYFVRFDVAALLAAFGVGNPELAQVSAALADVPAEVIYGLSFDQGRAQVDVAAPLEMIRAFIEATRKSGVAPEVRQTATPQEQPEAD